MTASAFFLMRRPWHLQLRAEFIAHEFARGVVGQLDAELGGDPLLDGSEGGKAVGLR